MDNIALKIANAGFLLILIGSLLWINDLNKQVEELKELSDVEAVQLIQCNGEVDALLGKNLELETKCDN